MFPIDLAKLATLQSKRLESDFKVLGRIGKGGFSKVYKVSNLLDKNTYALKKIELKAKDFKETLDKNIERVQREARYLARLSHPKIIRYFNSWVEVLQNSNEVVTKLHTEPDFNEVSTFSEINDYENLICFKEPDPIENENISRKKSLKSSSSDKKKVEFEKIMFYIQTEFCQQTLENYLQQRNSEIMKLKRKQESIQIYQNTLYKYEQEAKSILNQIIRGLDYLHNQCRLVHRDLKPGNIFMNGPDDVKIGDFGLVTKLQRLYDNIENSPFDDACTQMYAAPEQKNSSIFDQKSDVYALGLIILQLFHPISTSMELIKVMGDARKGMLPTLLREKHPRIANIILDCLQNDPKNRPNIDEILVESSPQSSKKNSNEFHSDSSELFIKQIGNCNVKFDDEDYSEKFLIYNNKSIQIFKNQKSLKAQMIYNLQECNLQLCDNEIFVQHSQLVNFRFTTTHNQLQDLYKELCELTQ